jgi:hypothetical protein
LDFTFVIVLIVLKAIADELEHQFGIQPNDLALDAMSAMIENTCLRFIINILSLLKNLNTTTSLRFYRRNIALDLFISNLRFNVIGSTMQLAQRDNCLECQMLLLKKQHLA